MEFKALSNAVQVTGFAPRKNKVPLGGVHDAFRIPEPSAAVELIK